jgi:hypothetical protein
MTMQRRKQESNKIQDIHLGSENLVHKLSVGGKFGVVEVFYKQNHSCHLKLRSPPPKQSIRHRLIQFKVPPNNLVLFDAIIIKPHATGLDPVNSSLCKEL